MMAITICVGYHSGWTVMFEITYIQTRWVEVNLTGSFIEHKCFNNCERNWIYIAP